MKRSNLFDILHTRKSLIEEWLHQVMDHTPPLIYASVDVRNAGFKISVVDTNLFPAGFNNLCSTFLGAAANAFTDFFKKYYPGVREVCLIPEEHTRNIYYWESIHALITSLKKSGLTAWVGQYGHNPQEDPFDIILSDDKTVQIHPLFLQQRKLQAKVGIPDVIMINNDLTTGIPHYLNDLDQILLPSPQLGWHSRRKSRHFYYYNRLIEELCHKIDVDPWLLSPITTVVKPVDWQEEASVSEVQSAIDQQLQAIWQKYQHYGIDQKPYVFIKNNQGTYGMAVMSEFSGAEV